MSDGPDLALADEIARELEREGIEPLLIGAVALAAHGFARATGDVDFGVAIHPDELRSLSELITKAGRTIELGESDANDPLGGVITIHRDDSTPVQVVNFDNSPGGGFPALVRGAEQRAARVTGLPGKLVSAEDLVLFKLYAGGYKAEFDLVNLFTHRTVDLVLLRRLAKGYRLDRKLDALLARLGLDSPSEG